MLKRAVALALIASLCFAGCKEEEPEPEPVEQAPPEPTADEIHQELYNAVRELWRPVNHGAPLSPPEVDGIINQFRSGYQKHAQHEHRSEAAKRLRKQLEELIKTGEETGRWLVVEGAIMSYKVMSPESTRYDRLAEYARLISARPRVRVQGITAVDDDSFILFKITDPETREVTYDRARVGERFAEGRVEVMEIIGNNHEIRLKDLATGDEDWIVPGPSTRY